MAVFPGEATPLFVSGEKHYRRLLKAPPLIRSDPFTCAIHFPSGEREKVQASHRHNSKIVETHIQRRKKALALVGRFAPKQHTA